MFGPRSGFALLPSLLTGGTHCCDHGKIGRWRYKEALRRTLERRPDLLQDYPLDKMGRELLREIKEEENTHEIDDQ